MFLIQNHLILVYNVSIICISSNISICKTVFMFLQGLFLKN